MSISAVGAASSIAAIAPVAPAPVAGASTSASSGGFAQALGNGLGNVQKLDTNADQMSLKAATGDLTDVHDYTIAANEASVATQLTAAVRDKAVSAFNDIMHMQV